MRIAVLTVLSLTGAPALADGALLAQRMVRVESRVRVALLPGPDVLTGRLVRSNADSVEIRLKTGAGWVAKVVPRQGIKSVELSRGRSAQIVRGIGIGTAVGGTLGTIVGLAMPGGSWGYVWTRGGTVATWGGAGAGAGAMLGLIMGALSDERWVPAVLPAPVGGPGPVGPGPALHLGWRLPIGF